MSPPKSSAVMSKKRPELWQEIFDAAVQRSAEFSRRQRLSDREAALILAGVDVAARLYERVRILEAEREEEKP